MRSSKYALLLSTMLLIGCNDDNQTRLSSPEQQQTANLHDDMQDQYLAIAEGKKQKREQIKEKNHIKEVFYWDVPLSHDLQDYIRDLCKEYGVEEKLAYAVMEHESRFNPALISSTNDYGLFQVNKVNHNRIKSILGISDFLNPFDNAKAGIYMLGELERKYQSYDMVLTAYNRGETGMLNLSSRGDFETNYSKSVKEKMGELRGKEEASE